MIVESALYLVVEFDSLGVVTLGLGLQRGTGDGLGADLPSKDAPHHIVIPQRPVQPTEEAERN